MASFYWNPSTGTLLATLYIVFIVLPFLNIECQGQISWKFVRGIEEDEELPNNAPIMECGPVGGAEDGQYIELLGTGMDPLCEDVQGYCRIRRNTNYTAVVRFIPKVPVESLSVRVTVVQPVAGWETSFWPEYSICGYFNMSCPMEPESTQQAWNRDELPDKVPPTRGLYRVRLMGTSTDDPTKRVFMCRQAKLQLY